MTTLKHIVLWESNPVDLQNAMNQKHTEGYEAVGGIQAASVEGLVGFIQRMEMPEEEYRLKNQYTDMLDNTQVVDPSTLNKWHTIRFAIGKERDSINDWKHGQILAVDGPVVRVNGPFGEQTYPRSQITIRIENES